METRIDKLESTVEIFTAQIVSLRDDVAVIKSNYVTKNDLAGVKSQVDVIQSNYATKDDVTGLKGKVDVIQSNYATKEDLAKMESTILKVFITTAIMLTGLVFGVAKYIH